MWSQTPSSTHADLIQIVRSSSGLMAALHAVRDLKLGSWAIGAGAVRNAVWDRLHGFSERTTLQDVDVVFFDSDDLSPQTEQRLQVKLAQALPDVRWDVTNQAAVHLWYEAQFGHAVTPLTSLQEGISTWPEYATCLGVCLRRDDQLEVIAPHGLDDLFSMVVRWNPDRVSADAYLQRIQQKRFSNRWPQVKTVLPFDDSNCLSPYRVPRPTPV